MDVEWSTVPDRIANPIQTVNGLCEELLRSHSELLRSKNILRKQQFIHAIKLDLDKLTHALFEVRDNSPASVLGIFFGAAPVDVEAICDSLPRQTLDHVGFEIHEPLDLVLYGLNHWTEYSKRALGVEMSVRRYLRFPASEAFQKRVGAYTEIMRIWLQVNDRDLMLELFDIHRPADAILATAPKPAHRSFNNLFHFDDGGFVPGHRGRLDRLFCDDPIWHYALLVKDPDEVLRLHAIGMTLAGRDLNYHLPYDLPVYNRGDGSFHTKIIRGRPENGGRMELEFVCHPDNPQNLNMTSIVA